MSYHNINTSTYADTSTDTKIKLIKSVDIDTSQMRTTSNNRSVRVVGDIDAVFSLQVSRSSDSRFYDFTTNAFEATYTSKSRLKNQNPGNTSIIFPAASSGDTYTIYVWPEPHFNTKLSFGKNRLRYTRQIEQIGADAVITFSTDTSIATISATSMGTSSGSSVNSYTSSNAPTVTIDNAQLTVPSSASDYGVKITSPTLAAELKIGTWDSNALYWQTTEAVGENPEGDGVNSTVVAVADLTGLVVGMELIYHKGTTAPSSTTTISSIDTSTKRITFSRQEAFEDTETMTFRAYGTDLISQAISISLMLTGAQSSASDDPEVRLGQLSTKLRTVIESGQSTADVSGTTGISLGAIARCSFIDLAASTTPSSISVVSGSTTAGTITVINSEFTAGGYVGAVIYIDGYSNLIYLSGTISITKYPTANQTIYIDTSKFLTAGTAS